MAFGSVFSDLFWFFVFSGQHWEVKDEEGEGGRVGGEEVMEEADEELMIMVVLWFEGGQWFLEEDKSIGREETVTDVGDEVN